MYKACCDRNLLFSRVFTSVFRGIFGASPGSNQGTAQVKRNRALIGGVDPLGARPKG